MTAARAGRTELTSFDLPGNRGTALVRLCDDERGIRISVIPAAGGEIAGMRVRIAGRWREILHRALDYDSEPPDGWRGRAPLLWPAVGRNFTPEQVVTWKRTGRKPRACRYALGRRAYPMPMHGFARDLPWDLESHGCDEAGPWVRCTLTHTAWTRRKYPFAFRMSVTHKLVRGEIVSRYELTAGANKRPMPFCIGNHISFRLPFTGEGTFESCTVRTPGRRRVHLNRLALLTGRTSPVALSTPVPVGDGIYADTFVTGYRRRTAWVEIADPASIAVKIRHAERPLGSEYISREEDINFVFWGNPELGHLCPEPWLGRPNALNNGRGLLSLGIGRRFVWEMRVAPSVL